jgi:O-antigen/teichoic acid export membrane protein
VFFVATGAVANVALGAGRQRAVAVMFVAEAVVTIGAILALVRPFGLAGVAWGIAAPGVAAAVVLWPWYARRRFGVGIARYLITTWVLPVIAAVPYIGATWLVERVWPAPTLLVFFGQVALLLPLAALGFWSVCLTGDERRRVLAVMRRARAS